MRTTITALLLAFAFAGAAAEDDKDKEEPPKENTGPGCGNSASIRTAISIIREQYHFGERKLELVNIRTTERDVDLGSYSCAASLRFEAIINDFAYRKGIRQTKGTALVPVGFDTYPDAVDPDKTIVSVKRIRALEDNGR